MRHIEFAVSGILIVLAGVVAAEAMRLGIGWGVAGPASGFFPLWLALLLAVASVANVLNVVRASGRQEPFVSWQALLAASKVGLSALGYVFLIGSLGIYGASAVYLALFMRWLGGHGWLASAATGLGVPAGIFILFEKWFLTPLPKGLLEPFLSF